MLALRCAVVVALVATSLAMMCSDGGAVSCLEGGMCVGDVQPTCSGDGSRVPSVCIGHGVCEYGDGKCTGSSATCTGVGEDLSPESPDEQACVRVKGIMFVCFFNYLCGVCMRDDDVLIVFAFHFA